MGRNPVYTARMEKHGGGVSLGSWTRTHWAFWRKLDTLTWSLRIQGYRGKTQTLKDGDAVSIGKAYIELKVRRKNTTQEGVV